MTKKELQKDLEKMNQLEKLMFMVGKNKMPEQEQNKIDEMVNETIENYRHGTSKADSMLDYLFEQLKLENLNRQSKIEIKNHLLSAVKSAAGCHYKNNYDFSYGGGFTNSLKADLKENFKGSGWLDIKNSLKETVVTGDSIVGPDSDRFTSINKRTQDADGLFRNKPVKKPQKKDEIDIEKKLQLLKDLFMSRVDTKITLTAIKKILASESIEFRSLVKHKFSAASALIQDEPDCESELLEHYFTEGNILNESSGSGASSMGWSNWQGVSYEVYVDDTGRVKSSNSFLARVGETIDQNRIDHLKSKGLTIITI